MAKVEKQSVLRFDRNIVKLPRARNIWVLVRAGTFSWGQTKHVSWGINKLLSRCLFASLLPLSTSPSQQFEVVLFSQSETEGLHWTVTMSMDHSPTTGVVTVIVILIAIAALGALILGCWCYLRLQRIGQSEDEESIVGEGETKEPFLLVQYSAKGPRVERKAKLTANGTEGHG
ncbi:stannin isoform X1 [Stegostoma tigrinum]|nr:stannin isoform X1 [Stegostoma tigrinum]